MTDQPKQFSHEHSSMFQDRSVAAAYIHRPPYPAQTLAILNSLIDPQVTPCRILDAGCGTGQMASRLGDFADAIDAVDISVAMIETARQMPYGADPKINWITGSIETVPLQPPYALIVAAASLHWMPWPHTLPRFANLISPDGYLALVEESSPSNPWDKALTPLIIEYSTNRDFQSYNMLTVAATLQERGLFRQAGVVETAPVAFRQPLDHWIEAIHARNGFSRQRMGAQRAADFDQQVRQLMLPYCPTGEVQQQVAARVVYGKPLAPNH